MRYDARVHCLKKLQSIHVKIAIAERPIRKYMVKERRCINISEISQLEHFIYVFTVIIYQGLFGNFAIALKLYGRILHLQNSSHYLS